MEREFKDLYPKEIVNKLMTLSYNNLEFSVNNIEKIYDILEKMCDQAFTKGEKFGFKIGYDEGYSAGYDDSIYII